MPVAVDVSTRLWLLGHGVSHSPSPAMQNAALRACGLDWEYAIRDVTAAELPVALASLRDGAAAGCNVTIPHKRAVAAACDVLDGDAEVTRAVNTVVRAPDGLLVGHNTDARGFELALRHDGLWPQAGSEALVLGAGGAAAAVVLALLRGGIGVRVAARNPTAVEALNRIPAAASPAPQEAATRTIPPVSWEPAASRDAVARRGTSLLVNATPAPLADLPIDVAAIPPGCAIVDLRYRYAADDLVPTARRHGLRAVDGLEMLLQQGMLSFQLWTGRTPPIGVARQALHAAVLQR